MLMYNLTQVAVMFQMWSVDNNPIHDNVKIVSDVTGILMQQGVRVKCQQFP
jgi:hypothetical protein